MNGSVRVRYVGGRAKVQTADHTLEVRRRDAGGYICPVDLVTAALGS